MNGLSLLLIILVCWVIRISPGTLSFFSHMLISGYWLKFWFHHQLSGAGFLHFLNLGVFFCKMCLWERLNSMKSMKAFRSQPHSTLFPSISLDFESFFIATFRKPTAHSFSEASLTLMLPDFDAGSCISSLYTNISRLFQGRRQDVVLIWFFQGHLLLCTTKHTSVWKRRAGDSIMLSPRTSMVFSSLNSHTGPFGSASLRVVGSSRLTEASCHQSWCVCASVKISSLFGGFLVVPGDLDWLRFIQVSKWFLNFQKWLPELIPFLVFLPLNTPTPGCTHRDSRDYACFILCLLLITCPLPHTHMHTHTLCN